MNLFTVGHSNHTFDHFVKVLRAHEISAVADVRSQPLSRFAPQFNRERLKSTLENENISYLFHGAELGARRIEPECYSDDVARYERIAKLPLFQKGIDAVRDAVSTHGVALMCREKDPLTCHRAILVCRHLRNPDLMIHHILEDGAIESHAALEARLLRTLGIPEMNMFQSRSEMIEHAYDMQGDKIAYRKKAADRANLHHPGAQ